MHTHTHTLIIRKELMLDLMKLALRDIEENYETFIDNQRKSYQRGLGQKRRKRRQRERRGGWMIFFSK